MSVSCNIAYIPEAGHMEEALNRVGLENKLTRGDDSSKI